MRHSTSRSAGTLVRAALATVLIAAGALVPASAASAADVTWGVRPAANDQGAARDNYGYVVDPGASFADGIVVANHGDEPLALDAYAADAFTTTSGQLDLLKSDEESLAVGAWITLQTGRVEIPAGEEVEIPFTVTVPENATPGDYAGGIITSLSDPQVENGIDVDRRLGIRVHLRVNGAIQPSLVVDGARVDYAGTLNPFAGGEATVTYTVRNAGNIRIAASQGVALSGPFGLLRTDAPGVEPVPELLPGESWDVSVPVSGVVPLFWLAADVSVSPAFPSGLESGPELAAVQVSAGTWAVPWSQLVLLVLVVGVVVALIVTRRKRRKNGKAAEDARVKAAVEAALREREAAPVGS
jgi:hypothetical protein